jgi:hypothetical protein
LNVTKNRPPRKEADRLRPSYEDGLNIQYHLKRKRHSFVSIGESLGVSNQVVVNVVLGRRRSKRIEAEIARILGKAGWNDVVLEARSEVQKKPAKVILAEMKKAREERRKAAAEEFAAYMNGRAAGLGVIDLRGGA